MFVLKKIISALLYPLPQVLLLFTVGLIVGKRRPRTGRILRVLSVALLLFYSLPWTSRFLILPLERRYPSFSMDDQRSFDTVVVLGGGATGDPDIPLSAQLSSSSLVRTVEGVLKFQQRDLERLILSGGGAFGDVPIAQLTGQLAGQLGVPRKKLILLDQALDTVSEAQAIREMVADEPLLLVTSAMHMPRAVALFEKQGLEVIPAPTDHRIKSGPFEPADLFPSAEYLFYSRAAVHEYIGLLWAKIRGLI